MVTYKLSGTAELSQEEKEMLAEAGKRPVVYDEDSPEMTEEMEQAFIAARKAKPFRGEPLTLYVSPSTMEKVKSLGEDYIALAGKLLDKAVDDYREAL